MLDKKLLNSCFKNDKSSYWHCPTCSHGYLIIESDTFNRAETALSKKARQHEEWEPEWISYVYSCIFKCSNTSCNERFSSSGHGFVDWDIEVDDKGYERQVCDTYFIPHYFHPPLQIINISDNIPKDIVEKLNKSFELFFCSPSSSANHARSALESILTHFKVPKTIISKNKKRVKINLHNRIDRLAEKHQDIKEFLIAIKWLGNEGSHAEKEMTKNDIIELYEILEHVLAELFDNKTQKLQLKAKKINKAKGL